MAIDLTIDGGNPWFVAEDYVNNFISPYGIKFFHGQYVVRPELVPNEKFAKSTNRAIKDKLREVKRLKRDNDKGLNGGKNFALASNLEKVIIILEELVATYRNFVKEERYESVNADLAASKAEKTNVSSQAKVVANKPEQERVKAETNKIKADKIIAESSPNSDQLGKETSGFKSLTESTKPKTAIPKQNKVKKPQPSISEMTANVPSITVTKAPSNKSDIDTLVASTTPNVKNLNKVFTSGNAKGIRKSLENPKIAQTFNIRAPQVNSAVNTGSRLSGLARDPFIQNSLKEAGLSADEITQVNQDIDEAAAKVSAEEQKIAAVKPQKEFSIKQFRALGNPIGSPGVTIPSATGQSNPLSSLTSSVSKNPLSSLGAIAGAAAGASNGGVIGAVVGGVLGSVIGDAISTNSNGANNFAPSNPFGSLGMDFGNIMASVTGLAQGTGAFKELGKSVPSIPGGIDPLTKAPVPNIVQPTGTTQLAKTVNKGTKTAVDVPTTPVKQVTKTRTTGIDQLGYDQLDNEFWGGYEPVNSKKEFELEIKSSPRTIKNVIVNWTATAENEFYTARSFNEKKHKSYKSRPQGRRAQSGTPVGRSGYQRCNYLIRKDGVVERLIPVGTAPTTYGASRLEKESKSKYQKIHNEGIMIQFDAGILGDAPEAGHDWNNLSDKSITAEQWKSFDMMMDVMYRHSPGGVFKGSDQLLNESKGIIKADGTELQQLQKFRDTSLLVGPQFDVGTYLEKKREIADGEDGEVKEVILDDTSNETVEVEDPYADLDDDYLNSEVINGNKVEYDEVRGRWQVVFLDTSTRKQYGTKDEAIAAARDGE